MYKVYTVYAFLICMPYVSSNVTHKFINKIENISVKKDIFNASVKKPTSFSTPNLKTNKNSSINVFRHLKNDFRNTSVVENFFNETIKGKPYNLSSINMSQTVSIVNVSLKENINVTQSTKLEYHNKTVQQSFPMLKRIHARITHSKDAIWATITLTFMCVLLVLAVAQSRMWKDHYYKEAQGIPLPNFNERVLFQDVMERKVKSLKQFFKKKRKTKEDKTELESLLPLGEWGV